MKKTFLLYLLCCQIYVSYAQDSTLIGRLAIGGTGLYAKSNIAEETSKVGYAIQFRYFPSPKAAFVLSYSSVKSDIMRLGKNNGASNSSIGLGFEKHFPFGNFSPFIGLEAGLNFKKVRSSLLQLPSNNKYFQQDLPNYLIKPKLGFLYKINESLHTQVEAGYFWTFNTDKQNTNPLFDESGQPIYFGRKIAVVSLGLMYLFAE
jgi:hypothetical protein